MKMSIAAALVFAALGAAPASAAARPFHCWLADVSHPAGPFTYYVSGVFETDALQATVTAAWNQHVLATYHVNPQQSNAQCGPIGATPAQQQQTLAAEEQTWKSVFKAQVIHITWSYAPDQATAPAAAAAPLPATTTTTPAPAIAATTNAQTPSSGAATPVAKTASPLNGKVGETPLGPMTQRIYISEDGDHIAIVAPKGAGEMVVIDGAEGPVFDEIPLNFRWSVSGSRKSTASVEFSQVGGHSAYVGRRGGDFIAVVDGKEAVTLTTAAALQTYGIAPGWGFAFNHDGSRLAYGAMTSPGTWVMVVDGVESAGYRAIDFTQAALNGQRLVYAAQTGDQQWQVFVDGAPGPAFAAISSLKLTPDGAHYAYRADRAGADPKRALVFVDGTERDAQYSIGDLEMGPSGIVDYEATTAPGDASGHGGAGGLFVGDLMVVHTVGFNVSTYDKDRIGHRTGSTRQRVAFSPDGKRFAYAEVTTPGNVTVMVNGKPMGTTYKTVDEVLWSPDGARLSYQASSGTANFQVVDGQQVPGDYHWTKEFQWSPDGKRYAFLAASNAGLSLVVDGKDQPQAGAYVDGAMVFSPDSKHLAYGARFQKLDYQPVIDGVVKPINLQDFSTRNNPPILFPVFSFSPDSDHLAYVGLTMDPIPKGGLIVDGTMYEGPSSGFEFPSWSPNSDHFAAVVWGGNGWTMMVDGKRGPSFEDMIVLSRTAVRFIDDRTLRFYGIKAGQVYRVTLDVGA